MARSLRVFERKQKGIVSVEAALIFPVLLFILVMFFELARIALVIIAVNTSLERSVQQLRFEDNFYALKQNQLNQLITDKIVNQSYGLVNEENVSLEVHTFSNLGEFSGSSTKSGDDSRDSGSDSEETPDYTNSPVLNLTLTLQQTFITPLPSLFNLGTSYQHEFQQVLGDLVIDDDEDQS